MKLFVINSKLQVILEKLTSFIILTIGLSVISLPALAGDVIALRNAESIRQDLYDLAELQESLLDISRQLQPANPRLANTIKVQRDLIALMDTEHLMVLATVSPSLREMNAELAILVQDLARAVKETRPATAFDNASYVSVYRSAPSAFHSDSPTSMAPHLGPKCPPDDSRVDLGNIIFSPAIKPPGFCNQSDTIPVHRDPITGQVTEELEYRLSDVKYPNSDRVGGPGICAANTPATLIALFDDIAVRLGVINSILEKPCEQTVAGFSGSLGCVVPIILFNVAEQIFQEFSYCNGVRRNAEGTTMYARAGEIFVQTKAHYASLGESDSLINDATVELGLSVGNDITETGDDISAELDTGFDGIALQMDALEQRLDTNTEKLGFVQLNDAAIEYKIWCDKQRPNLRPSDCQ